MVLSVIDYLLQLPEAMHFARVQELCGDGVFFYRMLSEYGNGTFQLIEFEDDLLLILIGDYTPKDTFEKITEISEDYMEISQFETDSSSFKIGGRKKNQVDKGIYCYLNTQKKTYTYRGTGNIKPKLSKMGGRDWESTKAKVKKEVEVVAYDLLRPYARRKMQQGIQFLPDTTWQIEMEEAFEYVETPDQLKAISQVKADMIM